MQFADHVFAGSYYRVLHIWQGGRFHVSSEHAHTVASMNSLAFVLTYLSVSLLAPSAYTIWVAAVIFGIVEAFHWYIFRRNNRYERVVIENLEAQMARIKTAVFFNGSPVVVFMLVVAFVMFRLNGQFFNDHALAPAIVLPTITVLILSAVLLVFWLVRKVRSWLGYPAVANEVSKKTMASWVLGSSLILAVMMASFTGGFLLLALLQAVWMRSTIRASAENPITA